ncbi:protein-glutamate O-methyltransferase CheR [Sediminicoccus sp. KRV36]|uniref:CheR family methyltransferase n=1 Tax=Sediminicoccus sp. KRV36 TaxID=3133721 RepID=UPI00200DF667|nr:protein-glutamate O-methyltransferase CheR [Sediminicoccus rosea]UPY37249.1 protein-glutamate O-methyltransferase CheR [Sediminicoccus rosea]
MNPAPLNPATFSYLTGIVKTRSGGIIGADQGYMLETRLAPLLKREALRDLEALATRLKAPRSDGLAQEMTELLTTNESSFFRDTRPFEHLRALLPEMHRARAPGQPLRIWSAACSTGQEAYSIAIILAELAEADTSFRTRRVEIIGTDITSAVVERARAGVFTQFEVQRGMPIRTLMKRFVQEDTRWRIRPEIAAPCRFEKFNLLGDLRAMGRFDVVFCRNVLIYFDVPTKGRVLAGIAQLLAPDGALYLGAAETAMGVTTALVAKPGERGVYGVAEPVRLRA